MSEHLPRPFDEQSDLILGDPTARSQIVWYIDYSAGRADRNRLLILDATERMCEQDAAIEVRPFARHEVGQAAAQALVASSRQQKLAEMHEAVIRHEAGFSPAELLQVAVEAGLGSEAFCQDRDSPETAALIEQCSTEAGTLGDGGQYLFIDNRRYDGVWDEDSVVEAIRKPFGFRVRAASQRFFLWAASSGLVLVLATVAALLFVNGGFHAAYDHLRETIAGVRLGDWSFQLTVEQWVNDGLMGIFFLLVGIEIKRELVDGELSSLSKAMLPLLGAVGGMVIPVLIYVGVNLGQDTMSGWGVPMATDIAFTLGLMALFGSRVPTSLKIFVSALAIADDLGAVLVIALFYGHGFHVSYFIGAVVTLLAMAALNLGRVYRLIPYLLLGAALWFFIHESGLHATLAGVLTAMAIPSRKHGNLVGVAAQAAAVFRSELTSAENGGQQTVSIGSHALHTLQRAIERLREPGYHLQHSIEAWTNFLILPLFAFFNMGVLVLGTSFRILDPESLGVVLGLMVGKPLGIVAICWVAVKIGLAELPQGVNWLQMAGAGCLCGVGFTMSIFIATAAFDGQQLQSVKLSILIASTLAAATGMVVLFLATRHRAEQPND